MLVLGFILGCLLTQQDAEQQDAPTENVHRGKQLCQEKTTKISGCGTKLCNVMQGILAAPCSKLYDKEFLRNQVAEVGLAVDERGHKLFGDYAKYQVTGTEPGLFQFPPQIADAALTLSTLGATHYVELGVWNAATCAFISTYLSRFGLKSGYAVDLTKERITDTTLALLQSVNVDFSFRKDFDIASMPENSLCFIDAGHTYDNVHVDFMDFNKNCKFMMFHDIV